MNIRIPATRYTYEIDATLNWRGVVGVVVTGAGGQGFIFGLMLGYRHFAFDERGMLDHKRHSGVKGIVRFARHV